MNLDVPGIFVAGLLTFFSPCILPLVPLYLSLLAGASASELREGAQGARVVTTTAAFAAGLSLVFILLGLGATAAGRVLFTHRLLLMQLGGLVVFLFGLKFLGVLQIPWLEREARPWLARARGGSLAGSFLTGAAFALGWTPCIGPVLGSVLTYTASTTSSPARGALYLGAYAAGLVLPLLATAAAAPLALRWLERARRHLRRIEVTTGVVLAAVGLLLLTDNLGALVPEGRVAVAAEGAATRLDRPAAGTTGAPAGAGRPGAPASAGAPAATCDGEVDPAGGGAPAAAAATCGVGGDAVALVAPALQPAAPGGPVLVEFVSARCPICQRMEPVVSAAEESCVGYGVRVERVDVGTPEGLAEARRHRVLGVPTFVFLDADGREVARLVGEQRLETLKQSLAVLAGHECDGFRALPR